MTVADAEGGEAGFYGLAGVGSVDPETKLRDANGGVWEGKGVGEGVFGRHGNIVKVEMNSVIGPLEGEDDERTAGRKELSQGSKGRGDIE